MRDKTKARRRRRAPLGGGSARDYGRVALRRLLIVLGCSSLVFATAHCGGSAGRIVPAASLGSERAKLGMYMGCFDHEEQVPEGVRHDAVRDEAVLVKSRDGETCFHVLERTAQDDDEPLDALRPLCRIEGHKADGVVANETIATQEYPYTARTERVSARGYSPVSGRAFNFSLQGPPEQRVFRVVERSGDVCCPGAGRRIELRLRSSRMQFNNASYGQRFAWTVQ